MQIMFNKIIMTYTFNKNIKSYLRKISPIDSIIPNNMILDPNILIKALNKLGLRFVLFALVSSFLQFLKSDTP